MAEKKRAPTAKVKTKVLTKKVSFQFEAPEALKVCVAGDFNNWDTNSNPMKKDKKGLWRTTLSLGPGKYEYRFLVDGNWENDPSCCDCVPNEFGTMNCVRIVE